MERFGRPCYGNNGSTRNASRGRFTPGDERAGTRPRAYGRAMPARAPLLSWRTIERSCATPMRRILVTGALGQIGSDLVAELRRREGKEAILETDIKSAGSGNGTGYAQLDVRDAEQLEFLVVRNDIDTIYHLASLLSARGEQAPDLAWSINVEGLRNVLNVARRHGLRVFWPSSIAVFGVGAPRTPAPQQTVLQPNTIYGVTKVTGELLCQYVHQSYGVDIRSLRYPGLISHKTLPGGGTTDYAVEMFIAAAETGRYTCYLAPETRLPMMYMPDAVRAALDLMAAPPDSLTVRTSYNLAAVSFSVEELADAVRAHYPSFECDYAPDFRQRIADSWPQVIDDSNARSDWGWSHRFGLSEMVEDMLEHVRQRLLTAGRVSS